MHGRNEMEGLEQQARTRLEALVEMVLAKKQERQ
jgi:hypothetical protein